MTAFDGRAARAGARARRFRACVLALALSVLSLAPLAPPALAQSTATLIADQVYIDRAGRLVAVGHVEIWHGSIRVRADRVVYDQRTNALDVSGEVMLSDGPDTVIMADAAQLSQGLREGLITSARVVLNQQMQISAARVERDASGESRMYEVIASSCPICADSPTPLWEIRAQRITHDETERRLRFERAQFRFAGVPVFYAPRLNLPDPGNTRAQGLLRPEISSGNTLGLMVGLPYFIPFGNDRDLTLTPRASSGGSLSLALRWRQAFDHGGYEIGGQITRDDILPGELRGYAYLRALFAVAGDFRLSANVMLASDRTYLDQYDLSDESRLAGDLTLERIRRDQAIRLRALRFYSLRATDVNDELPNSAAQADLDQRIGLGHTILGGTLRLQAGALAYFRQSTVDGVRGRDVARAHVQLGWRRSQVIAGGFVATAALDARADHIRVADDIAYATPITRRALQGMFELRWPLARIDAGGTRHVIEPIVQVIGARRGGENGPNDDNLMPELDQGNLFAMSRSGGAGAPDDGTRLNAGIRYSRQAAGGYSAEALIGRIWRDSPYTAFPHVQPLGGARSHWLLAGRLAHDDGLSFDMRVLLDPASSDLSRMETNLTWQSAYTDLSTRYLYLPASAFEDRATTLSEWSVDVTRRFTSGWATSVGWDFDIATSQFAEARTGLKFRNDCLSFEAAISRQFVTATQPTASTSFDLRIELLGIGGGSPNPGAQSCRG